MKTTILIGVLLAAVRIWLGFNIEPESFRWDQVFKDAAHLFMGGLAVAWWFNRYELTDEDWDDTEDNSALFEALTWCLLQPWQWWLFWSLNAIEVAVAVLSRI